MVFIVSGILLDALANIPAFAWILEFHGGYFMTFINGYLPVIALLGLICILPVIFEFIALRYERRKTYSEIQSSMMERYFTFQLANVYITVTAGSLWKALADILDHPMGALQLLGGALPTMVGYFVALLVTKMMAGLPSKFLHCFDHPLIANKSAIKTYTYLLLVCLLVDVSFHCSLFDC